MVATTIFEATYDAHHEITRTFDMVWALDVGLWNLRESAKEYFANNPTANNSEAKDSLVKGLEVHGLNLKKISSELSWEYEEQYLAELLLINAIAIFDTWVNLFVDSVFLSRGESWKDNLCAEIKKGNFQFLKRKLSNETKSSLAGCFCYSRKKQDRYINNLNKIYKYFKSCRNCCAHGNRKFTSIAERNYNAVKTLKKEDCGIREFPEIAVTVQGDPIKLHLRGVVGFYDVLLRIIYHYDICAADKVAVESELLKRCRDIGNIKFSKNIKKRNSSVCQYMKSINMCPPHSSRTDDIYNFLSSNGIIH